jgi:hypothetical protein
VGFLVDSLLDPTRIVPIDAVSRLRGIAANHMPFAIEKGVSGFAADCAVCSVSLALDLRLCTLRVRVVFPS